MIHFQKKGYNYKLHPAANAEKFYLSGATFCLESVNSHAAKGRLRPSG